MSEDIEHSYRRIHHTFGNRDNNESDQASNLVINSARAFGFNCSGTAGLSSHRPVKSMDGEGLLTNGQQNSQGQKTCISQVIGRSYVDNSSIYPPDYMLNICGIYCMSYIHHISMSYFVLFCFISFCFI